jgi:uncharacterized OB-fold protein
LSETVVLLNGTKMTMRSYLEGHWGTGEDGGAYLVVGTCSDCGSRAFGAESYCYACGAEAIEREPVSRRGTLYAFTQIHVAPPGFSTPFAVGYVDFPEGVRVFGQLETEPVAPAIGEPVEVTTGPIRVDADGCVVEGYKFRPVGEA